MKVRDRRDTNSPITSPRLNADSPQDFRRLRAETSLASPSSPPLGQDGSGPKVPRLLSMTSEDLSTQGVRSARAMTQPVQLAGSTEGEKEEALWRIVDELYSKTPRYPSTPTSNTNGEIGGRDC